MTHIERKKVKEQVYEEYFLKGNHKSIVAKTLNISPAMVMYYAQSFKTTQSKVREKIFDKTKLVSFLENHTFQELALHLNLSMGRTRYLLKRLNISRNTSTFYKKNTVKSDFYSNSLFEKEFYYFLGLFCTDGSFCKNSLKISIKNKGAKNLLEKLSIIVGSNHVLPLKNDYYCFTINDKDCKQKVIELGVPEFKKTYNLSDIYFPNKETLLCFLCGVLDGDGHIGFSKSKYGYRTSLAYCLCNCNIEFLYNIQRKLQSMLEVSSTVQYTPKSGLPILNIGVRQNSKEFFEIMYKTCPLYLECKYSVYLSVINRVMI